MDVLLDHTVVKFFVESLWRDEAFSWAMASRGLEAVSLTARDFNPPLYYLLLSGWMQLFGTSEPALRSLSVLCFCGTLFVAWRFMTDLLEVPRRRALVYLSLFALNPVLTYYAVEARMYSLLAFLAAASCYTYLVRRPVLYVLATVAGLYTHYFMVFVVLTQVLGAVVAERGVDRRRHLVVASVPVVLFVPWMLTAALNGSGNHAFWVDRPGWRFAVHLVTAIYTGQDATYGFLERGERWIFAATLVPVVFWSVLAGLRAKAAQRLEFLHVVLWALLPPALVFAAAFAKPIFVPRYLIFSTVGLLLLLVIGLERARAPLRYALVAVLCGLAGYYQLAQAHRHSKGEYRSTIRRIVQQSRPGDLLCVRNELDFFPAQYYFDEARVFICGPPYERIPSYVGKVLIPRARVVYDTSPPSARVFLLKNDHEYSQLPLTIAAIR